MFILLSLRQMFVISKPELSIFSKGCAFFKQANEMRNALILYSTSPRLEIVASTGRIQLQTCIILLILQKSLLKKRPPVLSFHLKNVLKCTAFVRGKVVVYAFSGQFKHVILQCFQSSLREKQSCKESHNDTVLECTPKLTE